MINATYELSLAAGTMISWRLNSSNHAYQVASRASWLTTGWKTENTAKRRSDAYQLFKVAVCSPFQKEIEMSRKILIILTCSEVQPLR